MPKKAKKKPAQRKIGRPTVFKPEYVEQVFKLCLLGATDKEIADIFGVDERTINRWKVDHPAFCQSMVDGKGKADAEVANSLYRRALGYSHKAVKIMQDKGQPVIVPYTEHYPPDTEAGKFWLKNRQKAAWRESIEHASNPENPVGAVFIVPMKDIGGFQPGGSVAPKPKAG